MPLSPSSNREFLTRRTMTFEGYVREDGLVDIEGHLIDVRGHDTHNDWRGTLQAGSPAHEMWARLTVDDDLNIVAAESVTDSSPYPLCPEVTSHTQRLVGLKIAGGFKRKMHELIGGIQGCTHVVSLLEAMATIAIHAMAGKRRNMAPQEQLMIFGARDPGRPPLLNTCYSYAAGSPVVAKMWPKHYQPTK